MRRLTLDFSKLVFSSVLFCLPTLGMANTVPTTNSLNLTLNEDEALPITLPAEDADGDTLSYLLGTRPLNGTLRKLAQLSIQYRPTTNYYGSDFFTFRINDGVSRSSFGRVNLTILPVNDAPVVQAQFVDVDKNTARTISLMATDAESNPVVFQIYRQPTHGTVVRQQGNVVVYTPHTDYVGTDSFQIRAKDSLGAWSRLANVTLNVKDTQYGTLSLLDPLNGNAPLAISNVAYITQTPQTTLNQLVQTLAVRFGIQQAAAPVNTTTSNGTFKYTANQTIQFQLAGNAISVSAKPRITQLDLATALCANTTDATCKHTAQTNLTRWFVNMDVDQRTATQIQPDTNLANTQQNFTLAIDAFERQLAHQLAAVDKRLQPIFQKMFGINLEAPQPEADEVGGQPVAFADVFRMARPFKEYSCPDITYDTNGFPAVIPESCKSQPNSFKQNATTVLFRFLPENIIPNGKYTVLYDGVGSISYYGIASKIAAESSLGRDVLQLQNQPVGSLLYNTGLRIYITATDPNNPIRNIRVVMPGGICEGNPSVRVEDESGCAAGKFRGFVDTFANDRNAIVFNPDYLWALKDFQTLRMMNFMEASPRIDACPKTDPDKTACLRQERTWEQRALLSDAVWGGSYLTPALKRYGVPVEVMVELANQLNAHPWFTLPHNATDDYNQQFASYVRDHLKPSLKAHVEYSNEVWNGSYLSALYARQLGLEQSLGTSEYWAGVYYYAKRATQIMKIWETTFNNNNRLVRILGTQQAVEAEWASRNMLSYLDTKDHIDALALAPYFWGCRHRDADAHSKCKNTTDVPKVLSDATTVDDIFSIINNEKDPYALPEAIRMIQTHGQVAADFNKALVAYEGGQHLTTNVKFSATANKTQLTELFVAANRDPRMGENYQRLLNAWKNLHQTSTPKNKLYNMQLFTLYTAPQSFHPWGNWGLKEALNQARNLAPKYNAVMQLQEQSGRCWWANCNIQP